MIAAKCLHGMQKDCRMGLLYEKGGEYMKDGRLPHVHPG